MKRLCLVALKVIKKVDKLEALSTSYEDRGR